MEERLRKLRDTMDRRARGEDVSLYIRTGLRDWDAVGGIERGILTVIGAATGDGKSIVALHIATAAAKQGLKVLLLSFEDPAGKTVDRSLSSETYINNRNIGLLEIDEDDYAMMMTAYRGSPWADNIVFEAGLRDAETVLTLMQEDKYDLVIIDYAQALPDTDGGMESTLRKASWKWNEWAQKNEAAVVVMSQLNREVEIRGRKQFDEAKRRDPSGPPDVGGYCPSGLSDVAWAKALADQCKCLLYWWRPNRMAKKLTGSTKLKDNIGKIIVGKANFAEEKDLVFEFDGPTATIRDKRE